MTETAGKKVQPNDRLRNERIRRGWSQQDLADKVGTTPLNVGRWERGITIPGPYLRQKLCEVSEKSPPELGLVPEQVEAAQAIAVEVNTSAIAPSPEAPTTLWNVPYGRNLLFTGREDILAHLRDSLLNEEQPVALAQPQAISGLGGIGKTQTAIEYAHRYRESYEAVFWARADSADLLASDFLLMAALLNLPQRNEQDQNVVVKAVLRWFDTHEQWLLILDNADQLEMVSEFMPSAGRGHVLLTTRANSTGTVAQRIEIEKMGLDEGMLFLLRRMKRLKGDTGLESVPEAVRSQAQAIVEAVDGLPLALDQAGAYIEETGCTLSDYLKFYKTRHSRLLRMRGGSATGHPEPVATTWSLSFEKVERANPAAAELLRLCAFLHPDEIPESMIIEGASELGPILQSVAEDELDWNDAIGELRKYSLVKRDPEEKILNIHRLVQAVIRDGMDKEIQREWAERAVRMVSKVFPAQAFSLSDATTWQTCQQLLPHVQICIDLIMRWNFAFADAAFLTTSAGGYLNVRGQYAAAEPLLKISLAIREQIWESNHVNVAVGINDLGWCFYLRGIYDQAEQLLKRSLLIREQVLESGHLDIAKSLTNLAVVYLRQGKYKRSEQLSLRALSIAEETWGPDNLSLTIILNNLAALYGTWGKYEQAEPIFQRILNIREQLLGSNHPSVAISLYNLARVYRDQAKYEQAEPLHQRALIIREQVLGPDHPAVVESLNDLALLYQAIGKYEQSESLLRRALAIGERSTEMQHPNFAETLASLAKSYYSQNKYEQAEALFQRALAIFERSLGFEHPKTLTVLESYAALLIAQHRQSDVEPLISRLQAIRTKQE